MQPQISFSEGEEEMTQKTTLAQIIALALALGLTTGCSGSSSKSAKTGGGGEMVEGGGGNEGGGSLARAAAVEAVVDDAGTIVSSTGKAVSTLGGTVSQLSLLGSDAVTSGTGDIITNTGEAVSSIGNGLSDGIGSLSENDNALGTTLAGVTGAVSETGEAVSATGTTVESLNTLPVFAQLDESTGLVTELGGTVNALGGTVTQTGNTLTVALTEEAAETSGLTAQLTAVVRPLIFNNNGITQRLGDALLVGPVANDILTEVGTAVVVLGNDLQDENIAVISDAGGTVEGVGQLVVDTGGILTVGESGDGQALDLAGLLGDDGLPLAGDLLDREGEQGNGSQGGLEAVVADGGTVVSRTGETVSTLGGTVSQLSLLETDAVTSGTGDIITNTGEAVSSVGNGLSDGLGNLSENDNALGTTLAGVSGAVSETGQAVSATGTTLESLNTLPVFAQLDESTGLVTELVGTVNSLGGAVTETGNALTVSLTQQEGHLSGLTTELTAVVRPLIININGTTQRLGDALLVGPVVNDILTEVGTAVVVLGSDLQDENIAVISDAGGIVEGVGQLVVDTGGMLTVSKSGQGQALDLAGLLGNGGLPLVNGLTGGESGPLAGAEGGLSTVTNTVDGLTGGNDLLGGVTDTVNGLTGSSDLIGGVTDTVNGLTGGNELVGGLTSTVDGLTGSNDLLGGAVVTVNDVAGGLLGSGDSGNTDNGLVDKVDDALLDPLLGGIL
jgi:hypothetical protein